LAEAAEAASEALKHAQIVFRSGNEKDRNRLATALNNFAVLHRDVGRFGEAIERAQKAEEIRRGLAEKQPDAYTADWATSLGNLADAQLSANKFNNALDTAKDAISRIRPFADRYPAKYKPWLGFAKRIAAESYFKLDRLDEALGEACGSVEIWADVVALRQNYESVQVAKAFRAVLKCEIALGQNEAAVATLGRAFEILRKPLNDNPRPLCPVMSELVDLVSAVGQGSIARVVPSDLLAIVRGA
jgi:tetratricopeptide (TPR) repeat protein